MNLLLVLVPALLFGLFFTVHVALSLSLAGTFPRWRALAALLLPPLAPYWGWAAKRRALAVLWLLFFSGYAIALAFAAAS